MNQSNLFSQTRISYGPNRRAIEALLGPNDRGVLAIITGTQGPSYRPVGAAMALYPDQNRCVGSLSSGCIEGDLLLHAAKCIEDDKGRTVRYGIGSPYFDIQLPCGGALEVTLIPCPPTKVLEQIRDQIARREVVQFHVHQDGLIDIERQPGTLSIVYEPDMHFTILGKGPEATRLAALAVAAGYPAQLFSPDEETRNMAETAGCKIGNLFKDKFPQTAITDSYSAIVLFFHDHDWEPALLASAVETKARYIGAQGSLRARALRDEALRAIGISEEKISRIYGPIGLVPSARDPQTLAVSVLAEALSVFKGPQ